MTIYKYRISTKDKRFKGRKITITSIGEGKIEQQEIPVPDDAVICDACGENVYSEKGETYGWLIYLDTESMLKDQPYEFLCDKCVQKYFPKAKQCYPVKVK